MVGLLGEGVPMRLSTLAPVVLPALAVSGAAQAGSCPFTASLAIQFDTFGAFDPPPIGVAGNGTAIVNGSASGAHLQSLAFPAGALVGSNILVPVTDPAAAPLFR